jgi:hypothetical protein
MTTIELWRRYQDWLYYHQHLDLSLDVSRVQFSDDFVLSSGSKFARAFADMAALEQRAIANPDEGRAVGLYTVLVNINAYHQPGVEVGKRAAAAILTLQNRIVQTLQTAQVPMTLAELAKSSGSPTEVETVYHIVRHLVANTRHVMLHGDRGMPGNLTASAA